MIHFKFLLNPVISATIP